MKNFIQLKTVLFVVLIVLLGLVIILTAYRGPTVILRAGGDSLYRYIESGPVGMKFVNEKGEVVTAPSHFFGPKWMLYIPDMRAYPHSYLFSITCKTNYDLAPTVAAAYANPF
jgi:hypothetical protein